MNWKEALNSEKVSISILSFVPIGVFLPAGYTSASLIIFLLYCISTFNYRKAWINKNALWFPIALFLTYLFRIQFTMDNKTGLEIIVRKISLIAFPIGILLVNKRISSNALNKILFIFISSFILCSIYCSGYALNNVIKFQSFSIPGLERPYYYFSYIPLVEPSGFTPIYLSLFCNFAFIATLETPFLKPFLKIITAAYLFFFNLLIASKIGVICSIVLILIWSFIKLKNGVKSFVYISILTFFLVGAVLKINFLRERFILPTEFDYHWVYPHQWNSITLHAAIWTSAIEAIKEKPTFGYGTGKGQIALEEVYKKKGFIRALNESYNAHNEFLSATLDLGIIGVLILAAMILFTFLESLRSKEIMLISFVVIYTLFFSVESILLRQKAIFFFSFFYSILFGNIFWQESKSK